MTPNTLYKSITIHSSPKQVWEVLTTDETIRKRCTPFSEGTHAVTDRNEWSDISRLVGEEVCVKGRLTTYNPHHKIVTTFYEGNTKDGFSDTLMDSVESYEIKQSEDHCVLEIISGPSNDKERKESGEMMNSMRDKALLIIKDLCEK